MGFEDTAKTVIVGSIMLLILATLLTSMNADLETQFTNTETQPNGALVLTIIALFTVGFAVAILLQIFRSNEEPQQRFGGQLQ